MRQLNVDSNQTAIASLRCVRRCISRFPHWLLLSIVSLCTSSWQSTLAADAPPTNPAEFQEAIQPFLKSHCQDCHSADNAEVDFRVDDIDGIVTNGVDAQRWEKVLEMIEIGDMPPPEADSQPTKAERRQITNWILIELRKIGRGPDEARLNRPEFGNRIDHEDLFSGEFTGPASSPSRMWRKSTQIYRHFESSLRAKRGNTPFGPKGGHGFQDYSMLLANESTIKTLRINAKNYVAELLDGRLIHPKGSDGKPDKTKQVREGKSRWREFETVVRGDQVADKELLRSAVAKAFTLVLYRSPNEAELQRYSDGFLTKSIQIGGPRQGLEYLLTALILSPEFVYRQEVGLGKQLADGRRMLAPNEIAFALAYALTDSPPDSQLNQAVQDNRLATKEDVAREVRRMLATSTKKYWDYEINHTFESHVEACPNPRLLRFFREYFGYSHVFDVFKDESRNPHHKPKFLFKDADLFVLSILDKDRDVLKELLTSDQFVVHYSSPQRAERKLQDIRKNPQKNQAAIAKLDAGLTPVLASYRGGTYYTSYGFEKETWDYPIQQPFKVQNRAGMLTHPAWLAAHSGNFDTDPIRRGKWIREHLLCDTIPDIPIGVEAALQEDPHKVMREKLEVTNKQVCWRCHKKMNPLGLPFEAFDDFGRYRTEFYFDQTQEFAGTYYERAQRIKFSQQRKQPEVTFTTKPIDTSGTLVGTGDDDLDGEVVDAFDLVKRLAASERVRQSFVRHAFRYWMGRNETLDDSPTLMAADKAYVDSDGSFKELLVSLLTSDSFLLRRDPVTE